MADMEFSVLETFFIQEDHRIISAILQSQRPAAVKSEMSFELKILYVIGKTG